MLQRKTDNLEEKQAAEIDFSVDKNASSSEEETEGFQGGSFEKYKENAEDQKSANK